MTDPALLAEFDRRFQDDPDPWRFATSTYEHAKRAATRAACGTETGRRVLELGAANGILAEELVPLAAELIAVEAVPTAASLAQQRLARHSGARVVTGLIPADVPAGPYDLVVASEVLYYLDDEAFDTTLRALPGWLAPGGMVVAVHWRPAGSERPRSADEVHDALRAHPLLRVRAEAPTEAYLLTVLEVRR